MTWGGGDKFQKKWHDASVTPEGGGGEGGLKLEKIERGRHAQGAARNHTCHVSRNRPAFCRDNEVQRLLPYAVFLVHCKVICAVYGS